MNALAVTIAAVAGLVTAWVIAGPKWGLTIGALAGGIAALVTLNGDDSLVLKCSDYFGGFAPAGCTDPSWWTMHGHMAIIVTFIVTAVIIATWLLPLLARGHTLQH